MIRVLANLLFIAISLPAFTSTSAFTVPRYTDPLFWSSVGIYAGAIAADAESTKAYERVGCREIWNPWLYGKYPQRPRLYIVSGAIGLSTALTSYKLVHSRHKILQLAGWGLMAWQITERGMAATNNMQADCR